MVHLTVFSLDNFIYKIFIFLDLTCMLAGGVFVYGVFAVSFKIAQVASGGISVWIC